VDFTAAAIETCSAGDVRIDCDMISDTTSIRFLARIGNDTGKFMPQYHRWRRTRASFDDVEIGSAHAARSDFDQSFIANQFAELFACDVEVMGSLEECDFHCQSELNKDMLS
jgi:hypothetical protein